MNNDDAIGNTKLAYCQLDKLINSTATNTKKVMMVAFNGLRMGKNKPNKMPNINSISTSAPSV